MINIAVEGESDREAAAAVVRAAGRTTAKVVVAGGKTRLDPKIAAYNRAARRACWVVFRDADSRCPVQVLRDIAPPDGDRCDRFRLRLACSMIESWLLADHDGFAEFFSVAPSSMPPTPDSLPHAKQALLRLCATSRSRVIRREMVARDGRAGSLYVERINTFARDHWDVEAAAGRSDSLRRAVESIRNLPRP